MVPKSYSAKQIKDLCASALDELKAHNINTFEDIICEKEAELELKKIPFFVRGKARRNTETFAKDKGLNSISTETLYEAKAHYAR